MIRRVLGWPSPVRILVWAMLAVAAPASAQEASALAGEIAQLKKLLFDQQRQIDELRRMLAERTTSSSAPAEAAKPAAGAPVRHDAATPLHLRIGEVAVTPIGFFDFTGVYRDTAPGSNIGTNFGSIPYRPLANAAGNLSEIRLSPQNSRIGAQVEATVRGTKLLAYWESDFLGSLGNPPLGNIAVSSNSYPLRLRLFWVDLRRGKWEVLAGQTWSLITPGRQGISPLPEHVFYSHAVDVNYTLGMPWGRIPELRFVYRPNRTVALALALDNPEQYIGGSAGGGTSVLPSTVAGPYASQFSNGTLTLNTPNLHPDIIAKAAFDAKLPGRRAVHLEVAGVERTFKSYLPVTGRHFTKMGEAVSANVNVEVTRGLRLLTNNYWSNGGGRYLFGQAPDLVAASDGHLSLVRSMGTLSGFEFARKSTGFYGYYGGVYIGRNVAIDADGTLAGYGFSGSATSHNRSVQEATFGVNQTLWKEEKWGALNFMTQYAYFSRRPWYIPDGSPDRAYMNEVWVNLRYTLPRPAPVEE